MNVEDAWIKAAVEHRILKIKYKSKGKGEITVREVEPDYYGWGKDRRNYGCWAAYDYLRRRSPSFFIPQNIRKWENTGRDFDPSRRAYIRRWKELIPEYKRRNLENIPW